MFLVCLWHEINGFGTHSFLLWRYVLNHNILALTVLASGSGIFYVYHYLKYFGQIFYENKDAVPLIGSKERLLCGLLVFVGMFLIVLAVLVVGLWAIWIATGWIFMAWLHIVLSKKNLSNAIAKVTFKREGIMYLTVGLGFYFLMTVVITVCSIVYPHSALVMYPYYAIFFLFVFLTIRQNMNTDYILPKLITFVNFPVMEDAIKEKNKNGERK